MSKYVEIETQMTESEALEAALHALGAEIMADERALKTFSGLHPVDLVARTKSGRVGFKRGASGAYSVAGDDQEIAGQETLIAALPQQYACELVRAQAAREGYRVVEECVEQGDAIRLVVRRWE